MDSQNATKDNAEIVTLGQLDDLEAFDEETTAATEAEELASKIMKKAVGLNGVKIDRDSFLRAEILKHCPEADVDLVLQSTPASAGIPASIIDAMAREAVDFETTKCAGLSFLSGIPGGAAMVATVPADLVQYFAHVMRVEQKLAYLYGWQSFLDEEDEVDDQTIMQLVLLMGVMLGVGSVASSISKFAVEVAQKSVVKTIQRQALTKTTFYPIMKNVLRVVGVNLTKQTFAKTAGKIVPVVGGALSGGLTYVSFRPSAEHLRQYLRSLPVSGVSDTPEEREDNAVMGALSSAAEAASGAAKKASETVADAVTAVGDHAAAIAPAIVGNAQKASSAVAGTVSDATQSVGSFIGSLFKRE